jgi:hypothetical protein
MICKTLLRTTSRTLLAQGSCVVTRPIQTADGWNTIGAPTRLSRQSNDRHPLPLTPFMYSFQKFHSKQPEYPPLLQESILIIPCWQHVQNVLVHKSSDGYLQMSSHLDIFVLHTFHGTKDERPQQYHLPNHT